MVKALGFVLQDGDLDLGVVQFLGHLLDDADDDVLEARTVRVVVQHQLAVLLRAPERGRPHAGVQGAQVVVQRVQILNPKSQLLRLKNSLKKYSPSS